MNADKEKRSSSNRRASKRFFIFLIILISALMMIFYVDNVFKINSLMKEIQTITKDNQKLKDENTFLRMEINRLSSFERISKIAEEKLGLIRSEKTPILIYSKDTIK